MNIKNLTVQEYIIRHKPKHKRNPNLFKIMVPGFMIIILIGAFLLTLPACNQSGESLNFLDALFTSCTCVCVTGLVTIVPASQFTLLGQIILLILIQIGGWGVIVCGVWLLVLLKRKISIHTRVILHEYFNTDSMQGVVRMLIFVVKGSLIVEGIGALGFFPVFVSQYGFAKGCFFSVFHAVSAFCNAGVDLLGETSLAVYVHHPWMNLVAIFLIVSGGLGFAVWKDLILFVRNTLKTKKGMRRSLREMALHTKLVLVLTTVLLFGGAIFFLAAEYTNPLTLGEMSFGQKCLAAFFQSVTTRTAGFYTVSQAALRGGSKFVSCIFMFIGGSPASTAGGMKTVTIAVVILTCWSILRGHDDTECFRRKIAASVVRMAMAVIFVGLSAVLAGTAILSCLQPELPIIDVMYEVVSAVATVGLTADVTSTLGSGGKILIICLMYIGRIGPITLPMMMAEKLGRSSNKRTLPEEHIIVG